MSSSPLNAVLQHLLADVRPDGGGTTDGELLTHFLNSRDDNVLAVLVRRHAPMVWGVCCRLLHNHHDAEDAFQATFLVLVRKAAEVPRQAVANWLYGVARQTAVRLRATAAKRGRRETQVVNMPEPTVAQARDADSQRVLDEELSRLPEHYRGVLVLCDLEGMTRKETARQLAIPEGSVASRLARARGMLAKRLAQRGLFSGVPVAAALSARSASASAPPALVTFTIRAASLRAAGLVSAKVAALTEGVVKTMFVTRIQSVLAVALVVAALAGAAGLIYQTRAGDQPMAKEAQPAARKDPKTGAEIDVMGAGETAMELVKTTKDADAKWMAIRILGNLRYERAIPLLLASLSDPHHYVRANAARALGDMRVAAAAKPLTELLQKEQNGGVIQQASLALANLGCADALPALKGAAKHEDVQTRMWVLQAVGRLGGKRDVPFLAGYLDDPSQFVQAFAAQAIEQITGADFGFPKRSGPSGPDEGLRRAKAWWAEHKGEYGPR